MINSRANIPLHGVTLETVLARQVDRYGWEEMGRTILTTCFTNDPGIKTRLKFLHCRIPTGRVQHLLSLTPQVPVAQNPLSERQSGSFVLAGS